MMRIGLSGYLSVDWAMAGPAMSKANTPTNAVNERMIFPPLKPLPSSRAEPPKGRRSRGTFFVGASTKQVPPLRASRSGRDDGASSRHPNLPPFENTQDVGARAAHCGQEHGRHRQPTHSIRLAAYL